MAFDQCPPYPATENDVIDACRRTHAWLARCVEAHSRDNQALFGIVQGGCFPHLRRESARAVADFDLPGIAVGGVSVGEPVEEMHRIVRDLTPLLPTHKPRYLMGIGTLREMAVAVANGIDLFDCVLPTRLGRHGTALVGGERWNLRNARFRHDHTPLDPSCPCPTCSGGHTRAYLNHLIRSEELLGTHPAEPPQHHPSAALHHCDVPGNPGWLLFRGFRSLGAGLTSSSHVVASSPTPFEH
jgi:queuine tRNA-ribosyltransferase